MGLSFSKSKQKCPTTVPTDTIVPFHHFNNQPIVRKLIMVVTYRFDDVLDAEKLRAALDRLLKLEGWRDLGARMRTKDDGGLEYHVPAKYDEQRPAFTWSHSTINQPISEHPLASKLPRVSPGSTEPQFFDDPKSFLPLVEPTNMPRKIDDWTTTDAPPLTIHVISFQDATLVTVSWNHASMDGLGFSGFMEAWTAVLAGREERVPPFKGFNHDPIDGFMSESKTPAEAYVLYDWMLKGGRFFAFVLSQIWEMVWCPKVEFRAICLPRPFVEDLQSRAREDIRANALGGDHNMAQPFVSSNDVLSAWMARQSVAALNISPSRPIAISTLMDIRSLIGESLPATTAYVGNMVLTTLPYPFPRAGDLREESLGMTALRVRKALQQQRTDTQVAAQVATHMRISAQGLIPLAGPWNMVMMVLSSWHKGRFFEFDLSPALMRPGPIANGNVANTTGKPTYVNVTGYENGISLRNAGPLIGKDAAGNWWIGWGLRKGAWDAFERMAKEGFHEKRE